MTPWGICHFLGWMIREGYSLPQDIPWGIDFQSTEYQDDPSWETGESLWTRREYDVRRRSYDIEIKTLQLNVPGAVASKVALVNTDHMHYDFQEYKLIQLRSPYVNAVGTRDAYIQIGFGMGGVHNRPSRSRHILVGPIPSREANGRMLTCDPEFKPMPTPMIAIPVGYQYLSPILGGKHGKSLEGAEGAIYPLLSARNLVYDNEWAHRDSEGNILGCTFTVTVYQKMALLSLIRAALLHTYWISPPMITFGGQFTTAMWWIILRLVECCGRQPLLPTIHLMENPQGCTIETPRNAYYFMDFRKESAYTDWNLQVMKMERQSLCINFMQKQHETTDNSMMNCMAKLKQD